VTVVLRVTAVSAVVTGDALVTSVRSRTWDTPKLLPVP